MILLVLDQHGAGLDRLVEKNIKQVTEAFSVQSGEHLEWSPEEWSPEEWSGMQSWSGVACSHGTLMHAVTNIARKA